MIFFLASATAMAEQTYDADLVNGAEIITITETGISPGALTDFSAYSSKKLISVCNCGTFTDTITVANTGSGADYFTIKKAGTASSLVSYMPNYFILSPGETTDLSVFGNVACSTPSGSYGLQTHIETNGGMKKVLTQQIKVHECNAFKTYAPYPSYKNLPCTPTIYEIKIKNHRDFADFYKLNVVNLKLSYYRFSESYLLLTPGEERSIYLFVNLPCELSGTHSFDVVVESTQTKQKASVPLYLTIDDKGYDFNLQLGKSAEVEYNKTIDVKFIAVDAADNKGLVMCKDKVYMVPVKLTNIAEFSNSYVIEASHEAMMVPKKVTVGPKQSMFLVNYFEAGKVRQGSDTYNLKITSSKGKLTAKMPLKITVEGCGEAEAEPSGLPKILLLLVLLFLILLLILLAFLLFGKPKKGLYDALD